MQEAIDVVTKVLWDMRVIMSVVQRRQIATEILMELKERGFYESNKEETRGILPEKAAG